MSQFFYNIAYRKTCFFINFKILATHGTKKNASILQSKAQDLVHLIHDWAKIERSLFEISCDKTKELNISFSRKGALFPSVCIDGNSIESVLCAKLLGAMINVNFITWNEHIEELVDKASRTHYFRVQLKRAQVPSDDLVAHYCACIRSSLDYACPVFHCALPEYLQAELEGVRKRTLLCIFPGISYKDAFKSRQYRLHESRSRKITN